MNHLWEYCCILKVTIRNIVPKFKPNRKKDKNLIQWFTNSGLYGLQLAAINRYQLYLQVIYLSDITTRDGKYISTAIYNSETTKWSTDRYEWPN